jgi:hypothetical protein
MSQAVNEERPAICTFQNLKKAQNKWTKHVSFIPFLTYGKLQLKILTLRLLFIFYFF